MLHNLTSTLMSYAYPNQDEPDKITSQPAWQDMLYDPDDDLTIVATPNFARQSTADSLKSRKKNKTLQTLKALRNLKITEKKKQQKKKKVHKYRYKNHSMQPSVPLARAVSMITLPVSELL